jgi:hypothetical protein
MRPAFEFPEQRRGSHQRHGTEDHTVTVCMLADALNVNKSTCHQILREDLGKRKFSARLVPHTFTQDQKEMRASVCANLLHEAQNDSTFVERIIAEDEPYSFQYDPQTKRYSAEWLSAVSPMSKKVRRQPSKTKNMIIFSFLSQGYCSSRICYPGQTVNQELYISMLRRTPCVQDPLGLVLFFLLCPAVPSVGELWR